MRVRCSPLPLRERGWGRGVRPGSRRSDRSPLSPALSREGRGGVHSAAAGTHGVTSREVPTRCVMRPLASAIGRARARISRCVPSWRVMR